ncbi:MAG: hypothetical protein KAX49_14110 [Halanaerobiales bacterium]|nr:hypothetical protein [Halanaerobiales bacterium]
MRTIDFEDQKTFIEEILSMRYGRISEAGIHHRKKEWLSWYFSRKAQKEIRENQ